MDRALFPLVTHVLLFRQEQMLLLRRSGTGFADGWFSLPGGHLQSMETPLEAVCREAREEVGVTLDPDDVRASCVMPYRTSRAAGVNFIFEASRWHGEPHNAEPASADQVLWRRAADLPERTVPFVASLLANRSAGRWYEEFLSR